MAQKASQKAAALAAESLSTPASRAAFSAASGSFAGMVSAITGLGGAVVFVPALSRLGFKAKDIVGTTVAAVTGATAAGSLAYAQKGVTGTLILIYPSSLSGVLFLSRSLMSHSPVQGVGAVVSGCVRTTMFWPS